MPTVSYSTGVRRIPAVVGNTDPGIVQYVNFASAGGNATTLRLLPMPNMVRNGNAVIVVGTCSDSTTPTISDDQGNTYTVHKNQDDVSNSQRIFTASCPNITNAPQVLRASGAGITSASFQVTEWCNLATSSAFNTSSGTTGTSTTPAPGSVTTTTANELVISAARRNSGTVRLSTWTKGAGQTLIMADIVDEMAVQYSIKAVAGAVTPSFTMDLSAAWVAFCATFKQASAGTPRPTSGALIIGVHHQAIREKTGTDINSGDYSSGNYSAQVPCIGTFLYASYVGIHDITGITDSQTNTWDSTGATQFKSPGQGPVHGFKVNTPTVSDSLKCTLALTTSPPGAAGAAPGDTIFFYDCQHVDGTSLVHGVATGTQAAGTTQAAASVVPPAANGIVFHSGGHGDNTTLSVASPHVFTTSTDPNDETSPWPNDENNQWSIHYNTSTAPSQPTYTSNAAIGDWAAIADAFGPA